MSVYFGKLDPDPLTEEYTGLTWHSADYEIHEGCDVTDCFKIYVRQQVMGSWRQQ